jgi:general secretion pathway protein G
MISQLPSSDRGGRSRLDMKHAAARGFTLIEILIVVVILGILAAIVIPQFSNASQVTRENTLKDTVRYMRTQIGVYMAQHNDLAPGYQNGALTTPVDQTFVDELTASTDVNGNSGAASQVYQFGPYLQKMPPNSLTSSATIKIASTDADLAPDNSTGWIYEPTTQAFIPNITGNDSDGVPFTQY